MSFEKEELILDEQIFETPGIPLELWTHIFSFLIDEIVQYAKLSLVAKKWQPLVYSNFNIKPTFLFFINKKYDPSLETILKEGKHLEQCKNLEMKTLWVKKQNFDNNEFSTLLSNAITKGKLDDVIIIHNLNCIVFKDNYSTEINDALEKGYIDIPLYLFKKNIKLPQKIMDEFSYAVIKGDVKALKEILANPENKDVILEKFDPSIAESYSPLMYSCMLGYADIVKLFLEFIPEEYIDYVYNDKTALTYASSVTDKKQHYPLKQGIRVNYEDCVEMLIKAGADVNIMGIKCVDTAIYQAVKKGLFNRVSILLKVKNININFRRRDTDFFFDIGHPSVLIAAIDNNYPKIVEILIKNKAKLDEVYTCHYKTSHTALSRAVSQGFRECVEILLSAGASKEMAMKCLNWTELLWITAVNDNQQLVDFLDSMDMNQLSSFEIQRALAYAVKLNRKDCLETLVTKVEANVNHLYECNRTLVMFAAQKGYEECLSFLIKSGADINLIEDEMQGGKDAILKALNAEQLGAIRILIESGAEMNAINKTKYLSSLKKPSVFCNTIDSYSNKEQCYRLIVEYLENQKKDLSVGFMHGI